jgi:glycosyltransferase involved in cell wall biosynthesis
LIRPDVILGRFGASSRSGLGKWLGYFDKFVLFPRRLKRELEAWKNVATSTGNTAAIVVHVCDHSNAVYTRYLQKVAHVVTCHDMLAVRSAHGEFPQNPTRWSGRIFQAIILHGLNRAQRVACVSETTARDLRRIARLRPEQISVVANSLNYEYSPMPAGQAGAVVEKSFGRSQGSGPGPNFVLHVGGNQWYKNRLGVLRIYARLVDGGGNSSALVLVGEDLTPEMKSFVRAKRLEDRVFQIQSCSSEELRTLYTMAGVLLFPSLAEGFGWPVIEAQACGCPVVCSRVDPFPEVAGDGACLVETGDEQGFTDLIRRHVTDPDFRRQMIARGTANARRFLPATMIANYLECYTTISKTASCAVGGDTCATAPLLA